MSFFQRLLTYVANEVIVKQGSGRVVKSRGEVISAGTGKVSLDEIKTAGVASKASEATQRAGGFLSSFRENYQREMEALRRAEAAKKTTVDSGRRP